MIIHIRFCTEGDALDAQIAKGQYGFWATHVEALLPDGDALRFDDYLQGWFPCRIEDKWISQMIVPITVTDKQHHNYFRFLGRQVGKPYDTRQLAGVRCHVEEHDGSRFSCGYLVYIALLRAKIIKSAPQKLVFVTARDVMIAIGAIVTLPAIEHRAPL